MLIRYYFQTTVFDQMQSSPIKSLQLGCGDDLTPNTVDDIDVYLQGLPIDLIKFPDFSITFDG